MTHYGVFDGSAYGLVDTTDFLQTSTELDFKFIIRPADLSIGVVQGVFGQMSNGGGAYSFSVRVNSSGALSMFASENGVDFEIAEFATGLVNGELYTVIGSFNAGVCNINVNGVDYPKVTLPTITTLFDSQVNPSIGTRDSDNTYPFYGEIYYIKMGTAEFTFDDDYGTTTLKNTGTGADAALSGATLDDFWQTDYSGTVEVKNGYGVFDNTCYVEGDTSPIHNGTNFDFHFIMKLGFNDDYEVPFSKYISDVNGEILFFTYTSTGSNNLYLILVDSAGTQEQKTILTGLEANTWIDLQGNFNAGVLTYTLNGGAEQTVNYSITDVKTNSTSKTTLGHTDNVAYDDYFTGEIAYAKVGSKTFDFTEQTGLTVNGADIINYYDGFWQSANAKLVQSFCGEFDGSAKMLVSDLVGTETVISSGGTSVPTIANGEITFTAGTCWELRLSSGHVFAMSEGAGGTLFNTGTAGGDATLSGATLSDFWSGRQDVYHYNMLNGFSSVAITTSAHGLTDIVPSENTKLEVVCSITNEGQGVVLGAYTSDESGRYYVAVYNDSFVLGWGNESFVGRNGTVAFDTKVHTFLIENGSLYVDGVLSDTNTGTWSGTNTEVLSVGGVYSVAKRDMTVYLVRIWENNVLVADYNFHSGIKNGFYDSISGGKLTKSGTSIYYPAIPALTNLLDIKNYPLTNPANRWHNGAETGIQLSPLYQDIQDSVLIASLTNNKSLEWINNDTKIRDANIVTTGTSIVEKVAAGTRLYAPDGDYVLYNFMSTKTIDENKTYKYYIVIEEFSGSGYATIYLGGQYVKLEVVGIVSGSVVASSTGNVIEIKRSGVVDITISKIVVWEDGAIPPLFYEEMEEDFSNKHQVMMNMEDKKHRKLVMYDTPQTAENMTKIIKCINK